jgi:hypothetical protein
MPEVAMVPTQVVCKMMRSPLDAVLALQSPVRTHIWCQYLIRSTTA